MRRRDELNLYYYFLRNDWTVMGLEDELMVVSGVVDFDRFLEHEI